MTGHAKAEVIAALRQQVEAKLAALRNSQQATQSGATHAETRAENAKDTRAIEASYLARGLARRVEALDETASRLEALELVEFGPRQGIGLTALVGLEDETGAASVVFLVPVAGGEEIEAGGKRVRPLTPTSPLGRALIGRCAGDEVELALPGGQRFLIVKWVR